MTLHDFFRRRCKRDHASRLAALRSSMKDGRTPPNDLLEYFAERFLRGDVRFWAGCSFWRYLRDPEVWDRIACENRRQHAARGGAVPVILEGVCSLDCRIFLN